MIKDLTLYHGRIRRRAQKIFDNIISNITNPSIDNLDFFYASDIKKSDYPILVMNELIKLLSQEVDKKREEMSNEFDKIEKTPRKKIYIRMDLTN